MGARTRLAAIDIGTVTTRLLVADVTVAKTVAATTASPVKTVAVALDGAAPPSSPQEAASAKAAADPPKPAGEGEEPVIPDPLDLDATATMRRPEYYGFDIVPHRPILRRSLRQRGGSSRS